MKKFPFDSAVHDLKLNILVSGYSRCDVSWRVKDLATPFCRLYIPEMGGGFLQTGGETIHMIPGNAYLLPSELPITYWCPETLVKRFFHLELLTPDHHDLFRGTERILQTPASQQQLGEMIALHHTQSYYSCLKLKQLLYQLLVELYGQLPRSQDPVPTYSEPVRATVSYIHRHLSAQLTVEELARRRNVSHTTLNKRFRKELGMTVGQYLDDRILVRARELLCHSDLNIGEISASLGFSDQFYFSNKFKTQTGYTPMQYRKVNGWRTLDK